MKALILFCFILAIFAQDPITSQVKLLADEVNTYLRLNNLPQAQQRITMIKTLLNGPLSTPGQNDARDKALNSIFTKLADDTITYLRLNNVEKAKTYINIIVDLNSISATTPDASLPRNKALESIITKLSDDAITYLRLNNVEKAKIYIEMFTQLGRVPVVIPQGGSSARDNAVNNVILKLSDDAITYLRLNNVQKAKSCIDFLAELNQIWTTTEAAKKKRNQFIEPIITKLSDDAVTYLRLNNVEKAQNYINMLVEVNNIPAEVVAESSSRDAAINSIITKLSDDAVTYLRLNNLEKAKLYINMLVNTNKIPLTSPKGKAARTAAIKAITTKLSEDAMTYIRLNNLQKAQVYNELMNKLAVQTA